MRSLKWCFVDELEPGDQVVRRHGRRGARIR